MKPKGEKLKMAYLISRSLPMHFTGIIGKEISFGEQLNEWIKEDEAISNFTIKGRRGKNRSLMRRSRTADKCRSEKQEEKEKQ